MLLTTEARAHIELGKYDEHVATTGFLEKKKEKKEMEMHARRRDSSRGGGAACA